LYDSDTSLPVIKLPNRRDVAWNTIGRGEKSPKNRQAVPNSRQAARPTARLVGLKPRLAGPTLAGLKAEIAAGEPMISSSAEPYTWIWVDAPYLREQAQRCTRLARDCPHLPTAHELEAIGVELMQKAAELDHLQEDRDAERSTRE
jgi:hypothetical protein